MTSLIRLSPNIQRIQQGSPYSDIYRDVHLRSVSRHAHPDIPRWENPGDWGARHLNDNAPFTLWNAEERKFRRPNEEELSWIHEECSTEDWSLTGYLLCIETYRPPCPIPLTLGTLPVKFFRPGREFDPPFPDAPYSNSRVPDPCPNLRWQNMTHPTRSQIAAVLTALEPLADVRAATFLPIWTIFELETEGNRSYEKFSLPGVVAGRTSI